MSDTAVFERELVFRTPDFPLDVSIWDNHPDYPEITHDFCEITLILSGTAFKLVAGREYPLKAGDVFALHGAIPHGYRNTRNLKVVNVTYDPSLLGNVEFDVGELPGYQDLFYARTNGEGYRVMHLDLARLEEVQKLSRAIEKELHPGPTRRRAVRYQDRKQTSVENSEPLPRDRGCQFMAMAHFMNLVGLLSRWRFYKPKLVSEKIMNIERALDYLEQNFAEPLDHLELARRVGMSHRNFHRIFHRITGLTPSAQLQRVRVKKAAHLLQTTDKSVTEIALQCGFADGSYFTRCFGKQIGMTPRHFREKGSEAAR
ncbi:helix-turn-helix domain-containing protein [Luteolibacter flavescens]|uniref:Helix-turn-helix domain-containing protein n=1 Tax=Luteolibacter flavescens TaxID=1859460 RepID=A0ABT3FSD3_9BACT|nr:helix-turn-helix domain-containing protein [Luteolibacter flavescens]MCW1886494.1 helix-turn-helix domain-containing protein [Luteolibacter flavescens]